MIQIRNILCPVDFSEFSRHAVDHAAAMARWYEAQLTVLHVFLNRQAMDLPPITMEEQDRVRITARMQQLTAHLPGAVPVALRVQEGEDVSAVIVGEAVALHADLLVLGSHGRSGFERLLLGSVTEKVMRKAPCATLIVPRRAPDTAPDAPLQFRSVLCSVDFSDGSLRALEYAMAMAEESDARLTLLHVIEVPPELREHPASGDFDVDGVRAAAEAESLRRLRELIPPDARTYCTADTAVREGAAYREILKVAAECRADVIVMGVQGRRAIDLIIFGSNTARVVRGATCPVLIVRQQ
jgi:nucleotide-binding universal stress UspA family protein